MKNNVSATERFTFNLLKSKTLTQLSKTLKKDWYYYILLLIPILYFVIFKYGPMYGNIIAFRRYTPGGSVYGNTWVGLKYFQIFLTDSYFWKIFFNTLKLSIYSLVFAFPIPIVFALLLNEVRSNSYKRLIQTISYLPHFISIVVIVGIINQLLSPSMGIVNNILMKMGFESINFLAKPEWFRTIYIGSGIWQNTGYSAILYIAALANIDVEQYEAATIDGANRFQQTLKVTLPGIMPTIIITLILHIGHLLTIGFEKVILLYSPLTYETADVISTYVYRVGLGKGNYSFASAIGLFDSVIGLILVVSANKFAKKFSETSLW